MDTGPRTAQRVILKDRHHALNDNTSFTQI